MLNVYAFKICFVVYCCSLSYSLQCMFEILQKNAINTAFNNIL